MKTKSLLTSSNPALGEGIFQKEAGTMASTNQETMTREGAINKSLMLFLMLLGSASLGWMYANLTMAIVAFILGFITALVAIFKPKTSPVAAPIYALLTGLFVGAISAIYASLYGGIIFHAVTLTMAILFMMLFIYKTGIIKVTSKFRAGVIMATGAVVLIYFISIILMFFGVSVPFLHEGGLLGIGFSLLVIGIASLNLLLDFDNFDKGEKHGAPKYMEWYVSIGLMITLVWLYVEILRLLALLQQD